MGVYLSHRLFLILDFSYYNPNQNPSFNPSPDPNPNRHLNPNQKPSPNPNPNPAGSPYIVTHMHVGQVSAQMLRRGCKESDKLVGFEPLFVQPQSYKPF